MNDRRFFCPNCPFPGPKEEKQVTQETQAPIEVEREELKTETKKKFSLMQAKGGLTEIINEKEP